MSSKVILEKRGRGPIGAELLLFSWLVKDRRVSGHLWLLSEGSSKELQECVPCPTGRLGPRRALGSEPWGQSCGGRPQRLHAGAEGKCAFHSAV